MNAAICARNLAEAEGALSVADSTLRDGGRMLSSWRLTSTRPTNLAIC
jgi:hypothetical protein